MSVRKNTVQPENEEKVIKSERMFTKEQLAASSAYAAKRDLVEALLEEGRKYTMRDVDNIIAKYLHGKER